MMETQKQLMQAGKVYHPLDEELVADRKYAHTLLEQFNRETDEKKRETMIRSLFGKTGTRFTIEPTFRCDYGYNIFIGENFYANFDCIFLDICPITIGEYCFMGPRVCIYTVNHPLDPAKRNTEIEQGKPVSIGDNVWIGGNAVITPGTKIGNDAVICAGAVVTKDVPDGAVVGGNPAKIIKWVHQ